MSAEVVRLFDDDWPASLVRRFAGLPVGAEFTVRDLAAEEASPVTTRFLAAALREGCVRVVGRRAFRYRKPRMRQGVRVSGQLWLRVMRRVA